MTVQSVTKFQEILSEPEKKTSIKKHLEQIFIPMNAVISLTVEIQFVSLIHLDLGEWIRGANPTFTELVDYHFLN